MKKQLFFLITVVLFLVSIFQLNSVAAKDSCIKITATQSGSGWLNVTNLIDIEKLNEKSTATITVFNAGEEGVELFFSARNASWEYLNLLQTEDPIFIEEGETVEYKIVFDTEDDVDEVVSGPCKMVLLELRNIVEDAKIHIKGDKNVIYDKSLVGGQLCDPNYTHGQVVIESAVYGVIDEPVDKTSTPTAASTQTPTAASTQAPTATSTAKATPNTENANATPTLDITYTLKPHFTSDVDDVSESNLMPIAIIVASASFAIITLAVCFTVIITVKKKK